MQQTIVALYETREAAERASEDLRQAGLAMDDLRLVSSDLEQATTEAGARDGDTHGHRHRNFFEWLFGSDVPEDDVESYRSHIYERGRTLLSVRADEDRLPIGQVSDILERHDPIDVERDEAQAGGATAVAPGAPAGGMTSGTMTSDTMTSGTGAAGGTTSGTEETVLPTATEELRVGKREVEGASKYRVRSYVVSRPVEEQVALREETVIVERRPPGAATADAPFDEKEVEVTERREEPVVSKVVRPGEDVVVRKDVRDHLERVRDTVRETKVDVDRAAAGDKPGSHSSGGAAEGAGSVPLVEPGPGESPETAPPAPGDGKPGGKPIP